MQTILTVTFLECSQGQCSSDAGGYGGRRGDRSARRADTDTATSSRSADPLLEFDRELYALVQLVQASSSICETAHVEHQDLWQSQQLDFLLGCHWSAVICCLVVCRTYSRHQSEVSCDAVSLACKALHMKEDMQQVLRTSQCMTR